MVRRGWEPQAGARWAGRGETGAQGVVALMKRGGIRIS